MINPESIVLSGLPSLPMVQKKELPSVAGIYFAIDSLEIIQYIGRSSNLRQRWGSHHRLEELNKIGGIKIAWLVISEESLLPQIEAVLIAYFNPFLNRAACIGSAEPMKVMFTREIPGLGAKIKAYRVASGKQLSQLAADAQISVPHWNRIENEKVKVLPEETLKGIELALNIDLGVRFDD